jgi:erythromycin esterase
MSDARSGLMARPPVAERCLAGNTVWWYEHTGDKIVYWGGSAHL